MDSFRNLYVTLQFAGCPITVRIGYDDSHMPNKWDIGRHCNADFEVHILLSGNCVLEIDNQNTLFAAPSATVITPGTFHYSQKFSHDFARFTFSFMSTRQDFVNNLQGQIRTAIICPMPPSAITLCRSILEEMSGRYNFREEAIRGLFTQLLVILFRSADLVLSNDSTPLDAAIWRTSIIDAFFSPWPEPFGTEDQLAAKLHLSKRQLNRVLMQSYGMGFRQKMLRSRMEYAGNLLQNTNQSINQIGRLIGYTADSSFYKAFQSFYHMTPQQYRKNQREAVTE